MTAHTNCDEPALPQDDVTCTTCGRLSDTYDGRFLAYFAEAGWTVEELTVVNDGDEPGVLRLLEEIGIASKWRDA